jgi:hypothetical protein
MRPRERILAATVVVLVGGWIVNAIIIEPVASWLHTIEQNTSRLQNEIDEAKALVDRQKRIVGDWRSRHAAGLLDDEAGARFHAQAVIASSAKASGFVVGSLGGGQLVTANGDAIYDLVRLTISGQGRLAQVQSFVAGLEAAAMPLRIERCEFAASDPKQDAIDVSMTVSTCILAQKARAGRAVPEGTVAWQPEVVDRIWDSETLAAKPFLSDRSRPVPKEPTVETPRAAPAADSWVVVGVVVGDLETLAFARTTSGNAERELRAGDELDGRSIMAITAAGVSLAAPTPEEGNEPGDPQFIPIGCDLSGTPVAQATTARMSAPAGRTTTSSSSSSTSSGASPFQVPAVTGDPDREAILERLRQQRNRKQ